MSDSKSILIVGGGVVGLSIAYYALERGHEVTVVDRAAADHEGCSYGNAGLIVPSHFVPLAAPGMVALGLKWMFSPESPFYVKPRWSPELWSWGWKFYRASTRAHVERSAPLLRDLNLASKAAYEELAASGGGDFGLTKKGLLVLCKSEHRLEEEAESVEAARKLGLDAKMLTAAETARLEPDIQLDIAGAAYFPEDSSLSPHRFMAVLRSLLEKAGAAFHWSTEVTSFKAAGSRIVSASTSSGEIPADEFVIAGGSWSPALARGLRLKLPMQAGKGYSLTLTHPPRLPAIPCLLAEARVAVTPMGGSLRFGGTMEIAGLNEAISPARVQGIIKSVPKYFPQLTADDFRDVRPWCGLRPCSPDGLPYLGRTASYRNLAVATGHAMMGLSLGPITGKLIAQLLSGERPSIDISLLSPDRYSARQLLPDPLGSRSQRAQPTNESH